MTKEEKIVQIAKVCGWWGNIQIVAGDVIGRPPNVTDRFKRVPDYFHDLNAMHEAEEGLTEPQQIQFHKILWGIVCGDAAPEDTDGFYVSHATAAQRAEAFGKTLNLWQ